MTVAADSPADVLRRFVELSHRPPATPFRSLDPFRLADAGILASREDEVEKLVRLITMYRGVLLYGESGSGKTSLVNAGLLPRLIGEGYWPHRIRVQPQAGREFVLEPIESSDAGADKFLPSAFTGAADDGQLVIDADEFVEATSAAAEKAPILIVVDQFEELVTLFPDDEDGAELQVAIIAALSTLLRGAILEHVLESKPMVRVKLVFAFREDYLAGLKPLFDAHPELVHQGLRLVAPPLTKTKEIIRAPFETFPGRYPREISPELAERIEQSLREHGDGRRVPLSELQIVCDRLSQSDNPEALFDREGVNGLLEDHMEAKLQAMPDELRDAAVAVLGQMITSSNTRNVVTRPDLIRRAAAEQEDLSEELLDRSITLLETQSGLIRRERRHDLYLYELTSEFLIPWISRQRDQLAAIRARRRQLRRDRRQRLIIAIVLAILLAFIGLAKIALDQRNTARRQRTAATDLQLAGTARGLLTTRPDVALVLSLAAYQKSPQLADVRSSMLAALEQTEASGATAILHGSANSVTSVAFDPAGRLIASASADGTIRLWSTATNRQVGGPLATIPGGVFSLAFSPDGRTIGAGTEQGDVRLWNVATRKPIGRAVPIQPGIVISVAFSPDHQWLAAAGLDGGIKIVRLAHDVPTGAVLPFAGSDQDRIRSIAFSPDSGTLASGGNDTFVRLWSVGSRGEEGPARRLKEAVYTVAFNPLQPMQLAAGGLKGNVYLLRTDKPFATLKPLRVPGARAVNSLAFRSDGRVLAAGNANDTIQLWNVAGKPSPGALLTGHEGVVTSVAFSPNGATLASGSTDKTIRLWPMTSSAWGQALRPTLPGGVNAVTISAGAGRLAAGGMHGIWTWRLERGVPSGSGVQFAQPGNVRSLAFDPADGTLASGTESGFFQRWRLDGSPDGAPIGHARDSVYSIAFSPDGRLVAFAGQSGVIRLEDLRTGRLTTHPAGRDRIFALAFSPDGRILASGGDDRTIRLWHVSSGGQLGASAFAQLTGNSDAVFSLAFPANTVLASGSADDTIRFWSVASRHEIGQPLVGSHGWVRSLAFAPGGRILVAGSLDGTIRLWQQGAQIGEPLSANASGIQSVTFTPNGNTFVSGGNDGAVRLWPLYGLPASYGALRAKVCSIVGAGLSPAEWAQYEPNLPYTNPCP